jgi:hypothetical protein
LYQSPVSGLTSWQSVPPHIRASFAGKGDVDKMAHVVRNIGFGDRLFLEEAEWRTYCRRKPVRYIRSPKEAICNVCGGGATVDNPLQSAHIIGFDMGVIDLGLTPNFLDGDNNIVTAHRRTCNAQSELDLPAAMVRLRELFGVKELPRYLPAGIHEAWRNAAR